MIIKDCVFEAKRYMSPYGTVPPPTGIPDVSRYHNDLADGAGAAEPTWEQLPSGLWVKDFDGNDVAFVNVATWRPGDFQGTMAAWFKTAQANTNGIVCSADAADNTRYLHLITNTGRFGVSQRNNDAADGVVATTATASDNAWHFGVVTSDGTAYAIYFDGGIEAPVVVSGANTGDWFADTLLRDNISFGSLYRLVPVYFTGKATLQRVWNYPLNADQVNAMFASERHWFDGV